MPVPMSGQAVDTLKAESSLQFRILVSWQFIFSVQGSGVACYVGPESIF